MPVQQQAAGVIEVSRCLHACTILLHTGLQAMHMASLISNPSATRLAVMISVLPRSVKVCDVHTRVSCVRRSQGSAEGQLSRKVQVCSR